MSSRGQQDFARLPGFAARLYRTLTQAGGIQRQHREIAEDLASRIERGRILDVGCGPGQLLFEIGQINPTVELFGLDISEAMVSLARQRLCGHSAEIRHGEILRSGYPDNFFDLVTCTGSFYLWDNPRECLDEIYRILRPGRSALLFESYRDCDRRAVREAVRANLAAESLIRRLLAPRFFLKQLGMTYSTDEFAGILKQTRFAQSYTIERIRLAGVPAWLLITLTKRV
jgi:ubiquinone/menaquinone biosynthesis C-methylase UbiE